MEPKVIAQELVPTFQSLTADGEPYCGPVSCLTDMGTGPKKKTTETAREMGNEEWGQVGSAGIDARVSQISEAREPAMLALELVQSHKPEGGPSRAWAQMVKRSPARDFRGLPCRYHTRSGSGAEVAYRTQERWPTLQSLSAFGQLCQPPPCCASPRTASRILGEHM